MEVLSSFYPYMPTSNNLNPRIFGCTSFVHIHSDGRSKLDRRALTCVFIGYSSTQKGYRCYHPPSHNYFVSRDVTFHEQESYFVQTHLQGENIISKEDESLLLPDLTFKSEVEAETGGNDVETEVDSENHVNVEADVRYGKNIMIHIQESDTTLHEVILLDPSNSSDSISEFSHAHKPESNSSSHKELESIPIKRKKPKSREVPPIDYEDLHFPVALRKDTRTCTKNPLYPLSNLICFE
jgi:hypothetical protein